MYDGITVDLIDHSDVDHTFNYLEVALKANYINCSTHIVINDKVDEFHKTIYCINVTAIADSTNSGIVDHNVSMEFVGELDQKVHMMLLRSFFLMLAYCCYW